MKVMFAIPAYDGTCHVFMVRSLMAEMEILRNAGIDCCSEFYPGCCYLPVSRNMLADIFLKSDATDIFFVDTDVEWKPGAALKILQIDREIIVGLYPHKNGQGSFPGAVCKDDHGYMNIENGLIEMATAPTGFMRIQRKVFETIDQHCPDLEVIDGRDPDNLETYKCYFDTMKIRKNWWGEDTHFCNIWRAIGGRIWAYMDIEFTHHGFYGFRGNFLKAIGEKGNV